jgi:Flp pilus assembly protein TadG
MLVLFTLVLVVLISIAGMLIDGGMASAVRRQAQSAADTAALAASKAIGVGSNGTTAASALAAANGFPNSTTDCSGASIAGVTLHTPPTSGPFSGNPGYVEVVVQRPMRTSFSQIVGQSCWMVSARAVASVTSSSVAECNFCSLNNSSDNHTLVLKNSATLRVDGEIYVNSTNGGTTPGVCSLSKWNVCGDGFDIFGAGGSISAKAISVVGGWETHDGNIAVADGRDTLPNGTLCPEYPKPPSQPVESNVCIHMPVMADPMNDPTKPGNVVQPPTPGSRPIAGVNGCPSYATSGTGTAATPVLLTLSTGTPTICPGTYFGGIKISGTAAVTMVAGVYNIVGGGFQVLNAASVDGTAGVMIYNSSGSGEAVYTTPGTDHVPAAITGHYNPKLAPGLSSDDATSSPGQTVTYTMQVDKNTSALAPTGVVDFYDSDSVICNDVALTLVAGSTTKMKATCSATYSVWGTRAISAVYKGDAIYNGIGDTLTQSITAPSGSIKPITINTTGSVKMYAPKSGAYGGLLIFQDRTSNLVITLSPGSSGVTCPVGFMTSTLTGAAAWKDGCGPLGGLQGTVYAPHPDALVLITAGGLSVLQVIAGLIEVDSGADARFAYNASLFTNGHVHLVE